MDVSIYRCTAVRLLVPSCFLPSREALALHGPAEFERSASLAGPGWDEVLEAMQERGFVALPLDHPLVRASLMAAARVHPARAPHRDVLGRRAARPMHGPAAWWHRPRLRHQPEPQPEPV